MIGKRPRLLLNKVGARLLIFGYYMPIAACIYAYVLYDGAKYYYTHVTKKASK